MKSSFSWLWTSELHYRTSLKCRRVTGAFPSVVVPQVLLHQHRPKVNVAESSTKQRTAISVQHRTGTGRVEPVSATGRQAPHHSGERPPALHRPLSAPGHGGSEVRVLPPSQEASHPTEIDCPDNTRQMHSSHPGGCHRGPSGRVSACLVCGAEERRSSSTSEELPAQPDVTVDPAAAKVSRAERRQWRWRIVSPPGRLRLLETGTETGRRRLWASWTNVPDPPLDCLGWDQSLSGDPESRQF